MTFNSLYEPSHSGRPQRRTTAPLESPAQLAIIGVVVWLVGAVIHPLAILAPIGLLLLLVAGVAYLLRPKRQTMFWRGREINLDDDRGPAQQFYRRLFRR
jgi:cbb3-type cytochrome oxidase subunit 3